MIMENSFETWDNFELNQDLLRGIYNYGFENPSAIQKQTIHPITTGKDVIGQAQSGCGKTGAFVIGTLQRIDLSLKETQAIIIAPTHELVKQIAMVVESIGSSMPNLAIKTVIGGTSIAEDKEMLRKNTPHIIIGSTGRILDMMKRRFIKTNHVKTLVLDEADEMLSRGFKDQIYNIFHCLKEDIQVVLFSATLPPEILEMTKKFMRNPVEVILKKENLNLEGIKQHFVALQDDSAKYEMLKKIFEHLVVNQCIIYANSVPRVADLCDAMIADGFSVCCIHGSMPKSDREKSFSDFRKGAFRVLISSDITARGIDIQQVSTVINFDIPRCVHNYLHRIGRSGRWGRKGLAINFITRYDISTMQTIERHYNSTITELPENFFTETK
jgi:translation initiation factor 4A